MPDYQALYYKLFAAMADAVAAIEAMNFGQAKSILIQAEQQAEDACIETEP